LQYVIIVNIIQLLLCLGIYFLNRFASTDGRILQVVLLCAELLIWFLCATAFGLGRKITHFSDGVLFGLVALLPIVLLTGISAVLGYTLAQDTSNWVAFFFLGSGVLFWHKPALFLSLFFSTNVYLLFAVNIVLIYAVVLLGSSYAITVNQMKKRKIKRKRKENKKEPPTEK
jgi:hypothetical protein